MSRVGNALLDKVTLPHCGCPNRVVFIRHMADNLDFSNWTLRTPSVRTPGELKLVS